jgi:GNAT superfamily N-acetyltransferase
MKIISVREQPQYKDAAIAYFQKSWPTVPAIIYEDCIGHSINAGNPLPQWYLLENDSRIIGCAGLITNDFISRMDLYPWLCAVFVEEDFRGKFLSSLLIEKAKDDARQAGFANLYLCTGHTGLYEKLGFGYIGQGYHPWGDDSRIYQISLK